MEVEAFSKKNDYVPEIDKNWQNKKVSYFLDSVNVAAVAVMLSVLISMIETSLINWQSILIAIISLGVTFGIKKSNVMHVILGGSILGYILNLI